MEKEAGVFAAHFPGRPIVPGVFLLRLAVEAFNTVRQSEEPETPAFDIVEVKNAKFLSVVTPADVDEVVVEIASTPADGSVHKIKVNIVSGEERYATFVLIMAPLSKHVDTTDWGENSQLPEVCGLIPTYNNAATLAEVVEGVKAHLDYVIVVNDGSDDTTAEVLAAVCGADEAETNGVATPC